MKNMGFGRLRVADPMRYEDPLFFEAESRRMAWGAADLLAAREEHATIESALADAVIVAGTTSEPPDGHAIVGPRALALRLLDASAEGPVALLFGQEDIGLTREAMARCQILGTIPSAPAYASLNLAQAALIFLYEIRLAAIEAGTVPSGVLPGGAPPPTQLEMEGFYRRLARALDAAGFFEGTARAHMLREVRRIFNRALLTGREVAILEGMLHSLSRARSRERGDA
jgi:TrmH family RNA methyltransferase